jgi:hypothetical protein
LGKDLLKPVARNLFDTCIVARLHHYYKPVLIPIQTPKRASSKIFICGQRVYVFELNTDLEVSSVRSRQTLCERRGVAAVALEIRVAFEFIFLENPTSALQNFFLKKKS